MAEAYLGEIRLVGFNFAPVNWMICQGQIVNINQFTALFSLLGTTFGGNGQTTFGLPNLQSRVAVGVGTGPGLSPYNWGQTGGAENVTLLTTQIPSHNHGLIASDQPPNQTAPALNYLPTSPSRGGASIYANSVSTPQTMNPNSISSTGGGQGHANIQPYLGLFYIICMFGIFPTRS